jgi:hypothetical protein
MEAQGQDVVRWLLLVGVTALGAIVTGLLQRRWGDRPDERWDRR